MNIWHLISLLDDISLTEVRHGELIANRLNHHLPNTYQISAEYSGSELAHYFDSIPEDLKARLPEIVIMTSEEMQDIVVDITEIRSSLQYNNELSDNQPSRLVAIFAIVSLLIGMKLTFDYIVKMEGSNQPMTGLIHDGVMKLAHYLDMSIQKSLGVKPPAK